MSDLLLELFSEEIPARMQRRAAEDLRKLVTDALVERGFVYGGAKAFATPRRLALNIVGLPAKGQDVREERRGPRVGSPDKAVEGFLKSAGLKSLDEAKIEKDPKKGEFYVAIIEKPGRATTEVLAEILPDIIRAFPWPKSMRWGAASAKSGALAWVRPLHTVVATFGPETEEPDIVRFSVDSIASGDTTFGHRFMAPGAIKVRRFDDYAAALGDAKVVLDADRRKDIILMRATSAASPAVECSVSRARARSSARNVASWTSTSAPVAASTTDFAGAVSPVTTIVRPRRGEPTTSSGRTTRPDESVTGSPRWRAPRAGPSGTPSAVAASTSNRPGRPSSRSAYPIASSPCETGKGTIR